MHIRKLIQMAAAGGFATLIVSVHPELSMGQFPPGGGGPPGGFGSRGGDRGSSGDRGSRGSFTSMSPDDRFNMYSGGRESFNVNQLPPDQKERFIRTAQFTGIQIPPDGTITRDYYKRSMPTPEQMRERFSQMRGSSGAPGGFGGAPGSFGSAPQPVAFTASSTPGAPPSFTPSPSGFGGPPGGFGGPPGGFSGGDRGRGSSNFDPSQMTDDQIRELMRRYDRDNDARISVAEAQSSDRLRPLFQNYDRNGDGFMDLSEYKAYLYDRASGRLDGQQSTTSSQFPQGGFGGPPGGYGSTPYGPGYPGGAPVPGMVPENSRPVVYRYGKLPTKDLPGWFTELDSDKDGQIGLYEWRAAKRSFDEFQSFDVNFDGFITAEEYLRIAKPQTQSLSASMTSGAGSGDPGATNGSSRGGPPERGSSSSRGDRGSSRGESSSESRKDEKRSSRDRGSSSNAANPFNPGK